MSFKPSIISLIHPVYAANKDRCLKDFYAKHCRLGGSIDKTMSAAHARIVVDIQTILLSALSIFAIRYNLTGNDLAKACCTDEKV